MLHIEAERREEEKKEGKGYLRQELRFGSLSRSLPLSEGVTEADIAVTYKDGVLEIHVPEPKRGPAKNSDQQILIAAVPARPASWPPG